MSSKGTHNQVSLIGRVGKDPAAHTFSDGSKAARFSVATSESWKDDSGAEQERVQWHPITSYGSIAEIVLANVKKGDLVSIFGALEHREYEKGGVKQRASEVVLRGPKAEIGFLSRPKEPR